MTKYIYTDGESLKNITLPQFPEEAWTFHSNAPKTERDELYASVAAVFRAANLSAETLSSLPFALVSANGEDFDTSEDWENKVGFMKNPKELLRLWRLSLFMTNSAYGFMESAPGEEDNLKYIVPDTITPKVHEQLGLIGFNRNTGTVDTFYPLDGPIFYMWRLDHTTELLPSDYTEFRALMSAAGIQFYADNHSENFYKRGGIKPTMLMVKGTPSNTERERIEKFWTKIIGGAYKWLGKVFNAERIEPITIGEGVDAMQDKDYFDSKLSDIAMAAGMPLSLLLANSANFATARVEKTTWFNNSVVPWSEFMAEIMNEQLFNELGLTWEFRAEMSQEGQEEEVQRADAYSKYVMSGIEPSIAAQIVGVDLPKGIEYEDLNPEPELFIEDEPVVVEEQPEPEQEEAVRHFIPTMEQLREMNLWQEFAFRKNKKGIALDFAFEAKTLPADIADEIRGRLIAADNEDGIKLAFELEGLPVAPVPDTAMIELAQAINNAVDVMTAEEQDND